MGPITTEQLYDEIKEAAYELFRRTSGEQVIDDTQMTQMPPDEEKRNDDDEEDYYQDLFGDLDGFNNESPVN